jgi:hypothetical protein
MPVGDWKQWAKERPTWIGSPVEDAFWAFIDQKWKDLLNVVAVEPAGWDQGGDYQKGAEAIKKGEQDKQIVKKGPFCWGPRGHGWQQSSTPRLGSEEMQVCRGGGVHRLSSSMVV